jgi:hypothetical protein
MFTKLRWISLILILVIFTALSVNLTLAQNEVARYFPETGHWVTGEFLQKYESVPDPILVFGYPITDVITSQPDPDGPAMVVQYFQRARFEHHPENPPELRVVLSPLGEYLYNLDQPSSVLTVSPNFAACRYFPETGFPVCYAFLDFFIENGGIAQFGYPISEITYHDNRIVQYFQRARFEWHPELPSGNRVTLTEVGSIYFYLIEDPALSLPNRDNIPASVMRLQSRAFVSSAVVPPGGTQTLYVIVQDQNLRPISNAQVVFTLRDPSGDEARYIMPLTNEYGFTFVSFPLDGQTFGIAEIDVTASYDNLQSNTRTSYRIWW